MTTQHGAATAVQRELNKAVRGKTSGTVRVKVAHPKAGLIRRYKTVKITASGEGTLAPVANPSLEDQKAFFSLRGANAPGLQTPDAVLNLVNKSSQQLQQSGTIPVRVPTK